MQPRPTRTPAARRAAAARWLRELWESRFTLDLRSLAAFRIGLGLLLVADALLRSRDFGLMFAADGFFPPHLIRDSFAGDPSHWSLILVRDDVWWAAGILALEGIAGACLAAGWQTRTAGIVAWAAQVSVFRRTFPAANAGDLMLSCLLFWSCFLPLGAAWSIACRRRPEGDSRSAPQAVCGPASTALILQVVAVYVGAGLSKWNETWLGGHAIRYALSIHDHGTSLGMWLASADWAVPPLTWAILGIEIGGPLLFLAFPAARPAIVAAFLVFHGLVWLTMSVGLFAPIGIVAWLALVPGTAWRAGARSATGPACDCPSPAARWACGAATTLAACSFLHHHVFGCTPPLPAPVRQAVQACSLTQEWIMFSAVPPLEQWVYARALLADGRVVDVLREGRAVETARPRGGFTSLPHHRWHKLFWVLHLPRVQPFAASVAAALVRDWNARHATTERVVQLELRHGQCNRADPGGVLLDRLVGSWPDRDARGSGGLERLLESGGTAAAVR